MLLCTWWRPQLDQNRFSALSAPKKTPSYSPELLEREPERFLDAGREIILLKPYGDDRYRAWWFEVNGRGSFYAYDAELQRFSEASIKPNSTSGQGPLMQQLIADRVSEMGMPTDAPTVSRVIAKVRKKLALRFAEQLGRPVSDEYLAERSRTPEFKEFLDEALEDLGERSKNLKSKR